MLLKLQVQVILVGDGPSWLPSIPEVIKLCCLTSTAISDEQNSVLLAEELAFQQKKYSSK